MARAGPADWEWEERIHLIKKGKLSPSPKTTPAQPAIAPPLLELPGSMMPNVPVHVQTTVTRIQPAHVHIPSHKTPLLEKPVGYEYKVECCVIM